MDSKKKKLLLMEALLLLTSCSAKKEIKNFDLIDKRAYTTYQDGHIYIGDSDFLDCIYPQEGDVLILDARHEKDPDFKIIDSYLINDRNKQRRILEALRDYENDNPSAWDRSLESMEAEWLIHNICYNLNIRVVSSRNLDLNNSDEMVYSKKHIKTKVDK